MPNIVTTFIPVENDTFDLTCSRCGVQLGRFHQARNVTYSCVCGICQQQYVAHVNNEGNVKIFSMGESPANPEATVVIHRTEIPMVPSPPPDPPPGPAKRRFDL